MKLLAILLAVWVVLLVGCAASPTSWNYSDEAEGVCRSGGAQPQNFVVYCKHWCTREKT